MKLLKHQEDNSGMTLVELIIGMAIVAIIAVMVYWYIMNSSNFYKSGKNEVDLQIEVQTTMDHISDEMLECESITSNAQSDRFILRKSQSKALVLVYDRSNHTLAQRMIEISETPGINLTRGEYDAQIEEQSREVYDFDNLYKLCENVKQFSITPVTTNSKLYSVELVVQSDGKEKSSMKQVALRNS